MRNKKASVENTTCVENTGRLCSVYCPDCNKVTDKISFNLLREAGTVEATCPRCFGKTILEYNGKKVTLWHHSEELEEMARDMMKRKSGQKTGNKRQSTTSP